MGERRLANVLKYSSAQYKVLCIFVRCLLREEKKTISQQQCQICSSGTVISDSGCCEE